MVDQESMTAYQAAQPHFAADDAKILAHIRRCGTHGATLDELCVAFNELPNVLSGRITHLRHKQGLIVDSGRRRLTRRECPAKVYVAAFEREIPDVATMEAFAIKRLKRALRQCRRLATLELAAKAAWQAMADTLPPHLAAAFLAHDDDESEEAEAEDRHELTEPPCSHEVQQGMLF